MPTHSLPMTLVLTGTLQTTDTAAGASLGWILAMGVGMAVIALVGVVAIVLPRRILDLLLLPMVGFAAGSLLGGAFFHLLPEAIAGFDSPIGATTWVVVGFALFLGLEQLLHWHRSHTRTVVAARPEAILILIGDALHNFLGGLSVGAAFTVDLRVGMGAWLAAAAHEVPQELGDFAILVHGGFPRRRALLMNFLSALTFPVGGVIAWGMSARIDVLFLLPFAAGNFLYIGAADLIPEIKEVRGAGQGVLHFACFLVGLGVLLAFAGTMH